MWQLIAVIGRAGRSAGRRSGSGVMALLRARRGSTWSCRSRCSALRADRRARPFAGCKAPSVAGRKVMDEIEGFRLYLGVAEEDRLNA